jgi:hypothetical protein
MVLLFLSALVGAFVDASKETIEQQAHEESCKEHKAILLAYNHLFDSSCKGVTLEACKKLASALKSDLKETEIEVCFFFSTPKNLVLDSVGFYEMCTSLWKLRHQRGKERENRDVQDNRDARTRVGSTATLKWLKAAVERNDFERLISVFLLLHALSLLLYRPSLSSSFRTILIVFNCVAEFILFVEFAVKLLVLGSSYFRDARRVFEISLLLVVLGFSLWAALLFPEDRGRSVSMQEIASAVLLLRCLTSVEKLFGIVSWHQVIRHSYAQAISNFMLFTLLAFLSFSSLGETLFCPYMDGDMSQLFEGSAFSLLSMLQVLSTSNWQMV